MSLGSILSGYWSAFQAQLFPALEQDLGPLGERYQALVRVVEFVRVERLLPSLQLRGQAAERPCGRSARLHRQGGVRHHHHAGAHRAAGQRLDAAAPVRLE